jgi:hypothetical protein
MSQQSNEPTFTVELTIDEVDLMRGRAHLAVLENRREIKDNPVASAPRKWLPVAESAHAKLRALFDPDTVARTGEADAVNTWPTASCCGEPRVTPLVDACYDHAKLCACCRIEPSVDGDCPSCAGAVALSRNRLQHEGERTP